MESRFSQIGRFWHVIFVIFSALRIILAINHLFSPALFGFSPLDTSYLYLSLAFYLSTAFIIYPAAKSAAHRVPWYDVVPFLVSVIINLYLSNKTIDIVSGGVWGRRPHTLSEPALLVSCCCGRVPGVHREGRVL